MGVDLAVILGESMASAGYGEVCPLPSRLLSLGERLELLHRGPG